MPRCRIHPHLKRQNESQRKQLLLLNEPIGISKPESARGIVWRKRPYT
ncbi:hypothetical protein KR50_15200 [Jeotgalibacillus campisalis]|uniref:Uncharacterized protein n=1 Tax=Jeotgalibacillus campisalis TaxID=220754 RepID=A0A0C2VTN2_9BACL|nr:hypothetical protein KR50_15200 [Jeotgalibacillus campisalis]